MKKILITGISGQDGIFLTSKILEHNDNIEIYGITRKGGTNDITRNILSLNNKVDVQKLSFINVDLSNFESAHSLINNLKPDSIFNLMGPSSVYESINNKDYYEKNLVKSFKNISKSILINNLNTKIIQASSSEMFDVSISPLNENSFMKPRNPYSECKYNIHKMSEIYRKQEGLKVVSAIMFNHESEFRNKDFLIKKIISTALDIKLKNQNKLTVGSLDYVRDWSFAGDVIDGLLLMENDENLDDYVIGSGVGSTIKQIIEIVFSKVKLDWQEHLEIDESLLRNNDPITIVADPSKIMNKLSWQPKYNIEMILERCIDKFKIAN